VRTERDGTFRLAGLGPWCYRLLAYPTSRREFWSGDPVLAYGGDTVEIRVPPASVRIPRLRLLCADTGRQVGGTVTFTLPERRNAPVTVHTGSTGSVPWPDLGAKRALVRVAVEGYEPAEVVLDPEDPHTCDVLLDPARETPGTVVLELRKGGEPVESIRVGRVLEIGRSSIIDNRDLDAPGGELTLTLPAGTHELLLRSGGDWACVVVTAEEGREVRREVDLEGFATVVLPDAPRKSWPARFETLQGHVLHPHRERSPSGGPHGLAYVYRGLPPDRLVAVCRYGAETIRMEFQAPPGETVTLRPHDFR
jgi:hypothetical protein